jgi:hypothetical protein
MRRDKIVSGGALPDALKPDEATHLARCEAVIERGVAVFTEVGRALTEIRDGKLYRAKHKTFEAYCDARWGIVRSRAYQLIDQAKVTDAIFGGVKLSSALDISHRDVQALKTDLPASVAAVRQRVDSGERPETAIKAVAASARSVPIEAQKADEQRRQEVASNLPPEIQQHIAAGDERRAQRATTPIAETDADGLEDLRNTIAAQDEEIAELRRTVAKYDDMVVEYERGGFANVIEGLRQRIELLQRQVERESAEKVKNLRSSEYWRKLANEYGANDDVVIDMATGEMSRG